MRLSLGEGMNEVAIGRNIQKRLGLAITIAENGLEGLGVKRFPKCAIVFWDPADPKRFVVVGECSDAAQRALVDAAYKAPADDEPRFYIYSYEHSAFWGPDRGGYYTSHYDAGLYTRAEAIKAAGGAGPEKMIQLRPAAAPLVPTSYLWDELHPDLPTVRDHRREHHERVERFEGAREGG